jgi:hypothetical protein
MGFSFSIYNAKPFSGVSHARTYFSSLYNKCMSCLGSLFNINIKRFVCCAFHPKSNKDDLETIAESGEVHNVIVLPTRQGTIIDNIFPINNHVEHFNILIIGSDRNYIFTRLQDFTFPGSDQLVNNKYSDKMPAGFRQILDNIWDATLEGKILHFYMIYKGKTYITQTFPLQNRASKVVGALALIRNVETLRSSEDARISLDGGYRVAASPRVPQERLPQKQKQERQRTVFEMEEAS